MPYLYKKLSKSRLSDLFFGHFWWLLSSGAEFSKIDDFDFFSLSFDFFVWNHIVFFLFKGRFFYDPPKRYLYILQIYLYNFKDVYEILLAHSLWFQRRSLLRKSMWLLEMVSELKESFFQKAIKVLRLKLNFNFSLDTSKECVGKIEKFKCKEILTKEAIKFDWKYGNFQTILSNK